MGMDVVDPYTSVDIMPGIHIPKSCIKNSCIHFISILWKKKTKRDLPIFPSLSPAARSSFELLGCQLSEQISSIVTTLTLSRARVKPFSFRMNASSSSRNLTGATLFLSLSTFSRGKRFRMYSALSSLSRIDVMLCSDLKRIQYIRAMNFYNRLQLNTFSLNGARFWFNRLWFGLQGSSQRPPHGLKKSPIRKRIIWREK